MGLYDNDMGTISCPFSGVNALNPVFFKKRLVRFYTISLLAMLNRDLESLYVEKPPVAIVVIE